MSTNTDSSHLRAAVVMVMLDMMFDNAHAASPELNEVSWAAIYGPMQQAFGITDAVWDVLKHEWSSPTMMWSKENWVEATKDVLSRYNISV